MIWEEPIKVGHWVGFKDLTNLHNEWLRGFLFSDDDQTLQAHRGSFKTTTLSLFFGLHCVIKPNETLLYFRKTGGDVAEIGRQTANILQSDVMQEITKILYGTNIEFIRLSSNEISTNLATTIKGTSQIVGLGIGTSITGKHADIVVTDDIVNVNDRVSHAERERTKRAYMELQNIRNRGGRIINTGTPWHPDDAFTLMPNIQKFDCYNTGLISEPELAKLRRGMSNSLFAANYELKHIASEDVLFTNPKTGGDRELAKQGYSHVDAAFYGEDYTAFTILNIHDGKFYVYGRCWRKHIDDVMAEIVKLHNEFQTGKMYVELNADKGYVAKQFRSHNLRVGTYHESQNKFLKISSHLKFEWDDVIFVEGTDQQYIDMICDYNEDAEHDDCPDSLASLLRIVAKRKKQNAEDLAYINWQ